MRWKKLSPHPNVSVGCGEIRTDYRRNIYAVAAKGLRREKNRNRRYKLKLHFAPRFTRACLNFRYIVTCKQISVNAILSYKFIKMYTKKNRPPPPNGESGR